MTDKPSDNLTRFYYRVLKLKVLQMDWQTLVPGKNKEYTFSKLWSEFSRRTTDKWVNSVIFVMMGR